MEVSWRYTSREERVQAMRGLGIYLSVGDVEAADREVRKKSGRARGSALSTERKRQQRFERKKKKKIKLQVCFFLDVCGLNCWPLKSGSSQACQLMDGLSRTPKQTPYTIRASFPLQPLPAPWPGWGSLAHRTGLLWGACKPCSWTGGTTPSGKDLLLRLPVPGVCIQMFAT